MTKRDHAPGYVPNPNYTQQDWDEVSDNPPLTDEELAAATPGPEGLPPAMVEAFRKLAGRPKAEAKAVPVSLRVPPDVLAAYKAGGPGWQTRMNEALAAGLKPAKVKIRWRVKPKAFRSGKARTAGKPASRKGKAA
ncbi:BrnA antitoxin family protein [Methylobacterium sp. J-026]|uniref:BrnA antitoxin family protein n=1 Tax=Methylobacterium sp. J-026 TaxID=2836624 RepID=UPI001FB873B4|nr:BrnA antitoxin family protein [Methylobacterium sp. J-026]MCJ2133356.1 BrnA antitoxin family protein [Methylobacterium sp. J-026]